jgi:hypothetical protein
MAPRSAPIAGPESYGVVHKRAAHGTLPRGFTRADIRDHIAKFAQADDYRAALELGLTLGAWLLLHKASW